MVGCILVAIIASYCARRYFADRHLQKTWQQCEQFLDDELLKIVSQSDAINGEVPMTEMELSRNHSSFQSNGFPLFTDAGFSLQYGVIFRWNGKRDEYAFVSLTAILPRIGNTPEFTIRGYKGRPLDLLVVKSLGNLLNRSSAKVRLFWRNASGHQAHDARPRVAAYVINSNVS